MTILQKVPVRVTILQNSEFSAVRVTILHLILIITFIMDINTNGSHNDDEEYDSNMTKTISNDDKNIDVI